MWFKINNNRGICKVSIEPGDNWNAEIIKSHPLDLTIFNEKKVIIEGKGPMWMYSHIAIAAVRGGAIEIKVSQPHLSEPILVYPLVSTNLSTNLSQHQWLEHRIDESGGSVVTFLSKAGERFPHDVILSLEDLAECWDDSLLTLTGQGANWMYTAVASLAAKKNQRIIAYFAPMLDDCIVLTPDSRESVFITPSPSLIPHDKERGIIIGVLGDPNSGKSSFSYLLTDGLKQLQLRFAWRHDCDHAAPTTNWYLEMIVQGQHQNAKDLRNSQKREWTPEAEKKLALELKNCARSLRWTVADFPGGKHNKDSVQRIPKGRERLIEAADHFIILVRSDSPDAEKAWHDELAVHGLSERILCIVSSTAPLDPLSVSMVSDSAVLRAAVTGLDRNNMTSENIQQSLPQWAELARTIVSRISQ